MASLWQATRAQLPVLEATLRQWRIQSISSLDPDSSQRKRIEREAARLLSKVVVLREDMTRGGDRVNAVNAVLPFIEVARSPVAGTEAKSSSVECLSRLVVSMTDEDDGAVEALSAVTEAVLECRFEQTNSGADEVAMMWLLETLGVCVDLEGVGKLLPEEVLFRVVETMFDGCTAPFNSDTTRAIALKLLARFLRSLFAIAPFGSRPQPKESDDTPVGEDEVIMRDGERPSSRLALEAGDDDDPGTLSSVSAANTTLAARKAFNFLVEMADPEHVQHAHVIGSWGRFVALRLLVEATTAACSETEGVRFVRDPVILNIVKDELMRTLIQTAQTVGNLAVSSAASAEDPNRIFIVSESLRLANILLGNPTSRKELKTQFECFFNAVYSRVLERTATRKLARPDEAVLVIESLCDLLSDPSILCDCFVSFDLHLQSTDVFENTFRLFSRLAFPHQLSVPALDGFRLLSLRGLLIALRSLTVPQLSEMPSSPSAYEDESALEEERHARELKARKLALHRCAEAFNAKPKQGVKVLMEEGVLSDPPDPLVFASFLRNTPTLEKVAIGQFLGEDGDLNRAVLRSFVETFDVRDRPLVAALRTFLECFRLPKEAQQIDRIVQAFADIAMAQCSDAHYFATVDACYILCFAIIMLNTDLHNPNIRPEKKMTVQQFISNNRNYGEEVSKGVHLPAEFLTSIYTDIARREINTMKDGSGITAEISRDRWYDLLARNRDSKLTSSFSARGGKDSGASSSSLPSAAWGYKKIMFETIWRPALAAVSVVFDSGQASEQPDALHSALDGFLTLAKAAARFRCREAFDSVVASLCKFTSLLMYGSDSVDLIEGSKAFNHALRDFGNHHKGQMAAMSVFALTRRFGSDIRKAWRHVLWCVLRLNDLRLLPEPFRSEESAPLEPAARALFHRKMREQIVRAHEARMKTKKALSSSASASQEHPSRGLSSSSSGGDTGGSGGGGGWGFASWLFGGVLEDDEARSANKAEADEEHRALMSALKVADAFCSLEKKKSPSSSSLNSPKSEKGSSRVAPSSPTGSSNPHHHGKHFESSDVLAGDADEIFSRVNDDGPVPPAASQYAWDCVRSCRPFGIVAESKSLSDDALMALVDALFHALGLTVDDGAAVGGSVSADDSDLGVDLLAPPSSGSRLIAVHMLTELVLRNPARFALIWPRVSKGLIEIIQSSKEEGPNFQVELACVGLLRICTTTFQEAPEELCVTLQHIVVEAFPVAPGLDFLVGRVVLDLVTNKQVFWKEADAGKLSFPRCGWGEFYALVGSLATGSSVSAAFAFDALKFSTTLETNQQVLECARCASSFVAVRWPQGEQVAREAAVVDVIFQLMETTLQKSNKVKETWIPLLGELAEIAQSESAVTSTTRKRALGLLQRACLHVGHQGLLAPEDWTKVLTLVVFPACNFSLREGESGPSSPLMKTGETKSMIAACELLAKVILAQFKSLAQLESFPELWVEVLQFLERFKHAGLVRASGGEPEGNALSEIVTELVKNLLLSMSAERVLSPLARVVATGQPLTEDETLQLLPPNAPSSLLWEMSWSVLDRSPGLRSELFPIDDEIDLRATPTSEVLMQHANEGEEEEPLPEAPPLNIATAAQEEREAQDETMEGQGAEEVDESEPYDEAAEPEATQDDEVDQQEEELDHSLEAAAEAQVDDAKEQPSDMVEENQEGSTEQPRLDEDDQSGAEDAVLVSSEDIPAGATEPDSAAKPLDDEDERGVKRTAEDDSGEESPRRKKKDTGAKLD